MRQPAHDQFVLANKLLAIDTQVLPLFMRTTGDGEAPGDQRGGIFRPALHDRDSGEIHRFALHDLLLAWRAAQSFSGHIEHLLKLRQLIKEIAEAFRRLWLFQEGQQLAHLAQRRHILLPHTQRHALRGAKEVAEYRH